MITKLKSKIHRATVIESNLNYEGSCAIDRELMEAANIQEYEQLHLYNVTNGQRIITYAICSDIPGMISLNGSAARHGQMGDKIIICTYVLQSPDIESNPISVFVNENNTIRQFTNIQNHS